MLLSAVDSTEYNDIDLVLTSEQGHSAGKINSIIVSMKNKGDLTDLEVAVGVVNEHIPSFQLYANCKELTERFKFSYNGTSFDVSYTTEDLDTSGAHIKLIPLAEPQKGLINNAINRTYEMVKAIENQAKKNE